MTYELQPTTTATEATGEVIAVLSPSEFGLPVSTVFVGGDLRPADVDAFREEWEAVNRGPRRLRGFPMCIESTLEVAVVLGLFGIVAVVCWLIGM